MKVAIYNDRISVKTKNELRALGNKLSIEEGLKFISTDLKIAPNCVELILTTLGYIYRISDHICCTKRLFKLTKYDSDTCTDKLTTNGLELLYRLVFNSICKSEFAKKYVIHHFLSPVIFNSDVQALTTSDDKKLIQIDVALNKIYKEVAYKHGCINIGIHEYHSMLENANKFKFNDADGTVAKFIADIDHYTYYIYGAENVDKFNIVNDLSIISTEIYINEEAYDKLMVIIDGIFRYKLNDDIYKLVNGGGCKIDGDKIRKVEKSNKFISLSLFVSLAIDNIDTKYTEEDIVKAMVEVGLIKIGDDDRVYINDSNEDTTKFLYKSHSGRILVRTDNILKLLCTIALELYFI